MEDDNKAVARSIRRRNKIKDLTRRLLSYMKLRIRVPENKPLPEERSFPWEISSYYMPVEYQTRSNHPWSPWFLAVRFMLADLPEQLKNGIGTSWRDHPVKTGPLHEAYWSKAAFTRLQWGVRMVFSEQDWEHPGWLMGRWLVVAYLWAGDYEWLNMANARNMITFENAFL